MNNEDKMIPSAAVTAQTNSPIDIHMEKEEEVGRKLFKDFYYLPDNLGRIVFSTVAK